MADNKSCVMQFWEAESHDWCEKQCACPFWGDGREERVEGSTRGAVRRVEKRTSI